MFVLVLLAAVAANGLAQERPRRIIDVHLHAYTSDPRFTGGKADPARRGVPASAGPAAQMSETFDAMRRLNIVKGVVSGDRDAVLRWHQADPGRVIIGHAITEPEAIDLPLLRREHAAGRLQVIGEVQTQYAGVVPGDPRMEPLYALAEELDVPVGLHMHPGPPGAPYLRTPKMRAGNGDPLLLEDVLVRHPKLRLYVMHAGWPFLERTIALLYAHPRVYVDVAVIDWSLPRAEFHRFLRTLVDAGFGKRILFGSDQMVWPGRIAQAVAAIEEAPFLTPEQKDDIFYNNAATFFRLGARP